MPVGSGQPEWRSCPPLHVLRQGRQVRYLLARRAYVGTLRSFGLETPNHRCNPKAHKYNAKIREEIIVSLVGSLARR